MTKAELPIPDDIQAIEDKLVAARTRLILDKPFLGALVLRLPLQVANPAWCPTTGTDARKFYYNPDYIRELRPEETQFVLAHEALHCALSHFARRQHRIKHRWDLACDYAINPILLEEGLKPPPGMIMLREYIGMSAEEIYPCIDDNDHAETMDQHLYDKDDKDQQAEGSRNHSDNPLDNTQGSDQPSQENPAEAPGSGQGQSTETEPEDEPAESHPPPTREADQESAGGNDAPPPPLEQQEAEALALQWQQRLAGAAQQALQAHKMSGVMQRLVDEMLQPRLPWRSLLAHYMTAIARDDYSFTRPSSRRGDPAIFPTLRSHQVNITVAVDVSGSISDTEFRECLAEIDAIKGQLRAAVTLIACDSRIIDGFPRQFEPWEAVTLPENIAGGGSTDFRPVFDWLALQDQAPDVLVYFTDAQGHFPAQPPNYPVNWLIKGRGTVPWGQRIQLN